MSSNLTLLTPRPASITGIFPYITSSQNIRIMKPKKQTTRSSFRNHLSVLLNFATIQTKKG